MTPTVAKITGRLECEQSVVTGWHKHDMASRPCKFPAKWRVDGRCYCTRHAGDLVLHMLVKKVPAK